MTPKRFFCNAGSKVKKVFEPTFTSSGARVLVCVGEEDLHGYIQSFKDQVDIQTIIKRFELGDPSGLHAQVGMYGDFSNCPTNLAEFLNLQNRAKLLFDQLPADVRATFNNDVNQFFVSYGSEEWLEKVKPFLPTSEPNPEVVT